MSRNTTLWSAAELEALFGVAGLEQDITGVSIDSRTLQAGDLFIALSGDPGPRFGGGRGNALDGHDYVRQAAANGAAAVMVHKAVDADLPQIRVPDTLDGLWQLGAAARARTTAKTVAVTGSSGKTTLRAWLESMLSGAGKTHASVGSLNNHWGVPLSLARMPADTAFGIFEVGTSGAGEIGPLSRLVSPHVSVLLNVLPAHIGNFADMAALTNEKLAIAEGLVAGGVQVLPVSLAPGLTGFPCLTFGVEPGADISAQASDAGDPGILQLSLPGGQFDCRPPFTGRERIESLLAAIAVMHAFNIDISKALARVESLDLPQGRGNVNRVGDIVILDDSYNANPVSMKMAIAALRAQPAGGRRIALLGEMRELGDIAPASHAEVSEAAAGLDLVIAFGDGFAAEASARHWPYYPSVSDFDLRAFAASLVPGDAVLVKGANKVFWVNHFVNDLLEALDG